MWVKGGGGKGRERGAKAQTVVAGEGVSCSLLEAGLAYPSMQHRNPPTILHRRVGREGVRASSDRGLIPDASEREQLETSHAFKPRRCKERSQAHRYMDVHRSRKFIAPSILRKCSGSMKITTHLDHISHSKMMSVVIWCKLVE